MPNVTEKYGLSARRFKWTGRAIRRLKALNAKGWSDTEIATEFGCDRHAVSRRREKLGLTCWYGRRGSPWHDRKRAQVRERTKAQLRAAGVKSLGEVRRLAYAKFARDNGWPEDLRPRAVQILNALAAKGPRTRPQLVEDLGMRWKEANCGRKNLASNDPEGSYLANLIARGLVCYLHRSKPSGRQGVGRVRGLYMLTLKAIEMVKEHANGKGQHPQAV